MNADCHKNIKNVLLYLVCMSMLFKPTYAYLYEIQACLKVKSLLLLIL